MNYSDVLNTLNTASLFDLYRLRTAIGHEMENPIRIKALRQLFKEGDAITYFDETTNALIPANVIQKYPKYVLVQNSTDGRKWKIPYYFLNLSNTNTDIHADHKGKLSKNNIKVGECVGFNHDGNQVIGIVVRLNYKTISLVTKNNHRWRASYGSLFKIIDADIIQSFNPEQITQWVQEASLTERN